MSHDFWCADISYFCTMQKMEYSFDEFDFGTKLIRDLVNQREQVKKFVPRFYQPSAVNEAAASKFFTADQRQTLVNVLTDQNSSITLSEKSQSNISKLSEKNTFTI